MADDSKYSSPFYRVTEKIKIFYEIYKLGRKLTHPLLIISVDASQPGELRAVDRKTPGMVIGRPFPQGTSTKDELALFQVRDCDGISFVIYDLLKQHHGDDIDSITCWRFRPREHRKIWIGTENEETPYVLFDHTHYQIDVDEKVLAVDFPGGHFGWPYAITGIEMYYDDYRDSSIAPVRIDVADCAKEAGPKFIPGILSRNYQ